MNTRNNGSISHLDESRQALRRLLIAGESRANCFPRSKTLRVLANHGAVTALAVGAGGLLLWRPRWIGRALRLLPVGTLLRMLAIRALNRL